MRWSLLPLTAVVLLAAACGPSTAASAPATVLPTTSVASSPPPTSVSAAPTPSASAATSSVATKAPSTASTTAAPGKVVTLPGTGSEFSTAAAIKATTWLTTDEKTFLTSELARFQAKGNSCAKLIVTGYRVADLINGGEFGGGATGACEGGGYALLWGKVSTWKVLVAGQDLPGCPELRSAGWKSTIPKGFYGGQCYEAGSTTPVVFKP